MRSVRRGEAAYLELMREAKAQFDAEIAKNKEKGKAGRPRKEVAPVVADDDDIEIDFSDVVPAATAAELIAPVVAPAPAKQAAAPKPASQKPAVREGKKPAAKKPAAKTVAKTVAKRSASKSSASKKPTTATKKVAKKTAPSKSKRGKA